MMNANAAPPSTPAGSIAFPALARLWRDAGLPPAALSRITLPGADPVLPSSFAIAALLQAGLGAAALAATEIAIARGAAPQTVQVDAADVLREASCRFVVDGRDSARWDKLAGLYRCGDGHWVRLHTNFAHHRDGALALLGLPTGPTTEREAVQAALQGWTGEAFESAAAERGLVVALVRSAAQWQAHPQAAALATQALLAFEQLDNCPARPWPTVAALQRPLQGLRVLDLTRILAGPVATRTLAAYGADVLRISSPHLPDIDALPDTNRGKLAARLDLQQPGDRDTLRELVRGCDVFLQGYRPGALAALGFGPDELARLRQGIVVMSLSAYGTQGPWAGRRGFDSLVQSATGINVEEAQAFDQESPRALPVQALDYGAAHLLAFGTASALLRQRKSGGSWAVSVSLAGVGRRLQGLPRVPIQELPPMSFDGAMEDSDSGYGRLSAVRHAARFSGFVASDLRPSMPSGSHAPAWPAH